MPSERDKTKRWWQFGLRELLVWFAIAGISLGWFIDHLNLAASNRRLASENANLTDVVEVTKDAIKGLGMKLEYKVDAGSSHVIVTIEDELGLHQLISDRPIQLPAP